MHLAATNGASLNWRTRHRSVTAKNAAMPWLRFQRGATRGAVVEEPARVCRHRFFRAMTALRAGNDRAQSDAGRLLFAPAEKEIIPDARRAQCSDAEIHDRRR